MMKKIIFFVCLAPFLMQCRSAKITPNSVASVQEQGCITCFAEGLGGGKTTCEASAIVYDGSKLLIANDKDMPDGRTSVFYYKGNKLSGDTTGRIYLQNPIFKQGKKYEDFALAPNGLVFLTTAFDRKKDNSTEWDAYNTILYWQKGSEEQPRVLSYETGAQTSILLRDKIAKVLADEEFKEKMPYFKIEGIAATNTHLYLGVRETGKSFQNPTYLVKIIEVPYSVVNNEVKLGEMAVICDFKPQIDKLPLGLSSIEYDPTNHVFIIITSYESGENFGAYLWIASLEDLKSSRIRPLKNSDNTQLFIKSKVEDIAIVGKNTYYLIHDDDRVKTTIGNKTRQLNQAIYTVVHIKN